MPAWLLPLIVALIVATDHSPLSSGDNGESGDVHGDDDDDVSSVVLMLVAEIAQCKIGE